MEMGVRPKLGAGEGAKVGSSVCFTGAWVTFTGESVGTFVALTGAFVALTGARVGTVVGALVTGVFEQCWYLLQQSIPPAGCAWQQGEQIYLWHSSNIQPDVDRRLQQAHQKAVAILATFRPSSTIGRHCSPFFSCLLRTPP